MSSQSDSQQHQLLRRHLQLPLLQQQFVGFQPCLLLLKVQIGIALAQLG